MDPIEEEELKRSLKKRYKEYQDYVDQIQKEDSSEKTGELKGKVVRNITSTTPNIFSKIPK